MACFNPMLARPGSAKFSSGKPVLIFRRKDSDLPPSDFSMSIPCSQCIGCRMEYGRQWAMRCVKEAESHASNCFVTLTYNGDRDFTSLDKRDLVLFMKKIRNNYGNGIRFFAAGEYTQAFRPHFHVLFFGLDFADKVPFKKSPSGEMLYRSDGLEKLWTAGYSSIGAVTFESAGYVAKYALKKVTGVVANDVFRSTIEDFGLVPEFVQMSRGSKKLGTGGIGRAWFEKYADEVFPMDRVFMRDKWMKPPRFFMNVYAKDHPLEVELLKLDRKNNVDMDDNTDIRLIAKERSAELNLARRKKSLEVIR